MTLNSARHLIKMNRISYSKIVFGLKHKQRFYNSRAVSELVHSLRIIISEHDATTDFCEYPDMHYHGIIEHGKDRNSEDNDAIILLRKYCAYFIMENCEDPENCLIELSQPPKKIMVIEVENSFDLKSHYSNIFVGGIGLKQNDFEKKSLLMEVMNLMISDISSRRTMDIAKIMKDTCKYCLLSNQHETLTKHSLGLVQKKILNQSILKLCARFIRVPESYYTLKESAGLVVEWCRYQNIELEEFITSWINCLDRQVFYRNTLYFQGSNDSGIIKIIQSIKEACAFIGEVDHGFTGYAYVWENCLEKRCIFMREPTFDECMFEKLENILKGIGTYVPDRRSILNYLQPTPVVICCQDNKKNHLLMQRLEASFLKSFENLKPFMKLSGDHRQLHPEWLSVLYSSLTGNNFDNTASCCDDRLVEPMDSDSLLDTIEEISVTRPGAEIIDSPTQVVCYSSNPSSLQEI